MSYWKMFEFRRVLTHRRWLVPAAATAAFGLAVYVVALRFLFPYAEMSRWVETRFRAAGLDAKVEGLGPSGLTGFRAESIVLSPPGAPDRRTEIRDAALRVSLLSLARFRPSVSLEAEAMGGRLAADFTLRAPQRVQAQWSGVELSRAPLAPDWSALGLRGRATGGLDGTLTDALAASPGFVGILETQVADAKLGPGDLRGLPLPGVSLGTGRIRLAAKSNRIDVETVRFEGGNLDVSFNGKVEFSNRAPNGAVDGMLSLRPRGRTADDLGFLLAFFPAPPSSDGTYAARVGGSPGSLILAPADGAR